MTARQDKTNALARLDRLRKRLHVPPPPPPPPPERFSPTRGIDCFRCDFRRLPVKAGRWTRSSRTFRGRASWLDNVEEFSEWCASVLKPNGIMATLYTANNLNQLLAGLDKHLHYVWTCTSPMHGATLMRRPYVTRSCTLCVVCSNTDTPEIHRSPCDLLPFSWREGTATTSTSSRCRWCSTLWNTSRRRRIPCATLVRVVGPRWWRVCGPGGSSSVPTTERTASKSPAAGSAT